MYPNTYAPQPQQFAPPPQQQQFAPQPVAQPQWAPQPVQQQFRPAQPQSQHAGMVAQGQFVHLNRVELIGMVLPTQYAPQGWKWMPGNDGKQGHLEINLFVRKQWGGQNPGKSESKFKVVAYGALGQDLSTKIGPGAMIRVVGELKVSYYQAKQGPQAGQWKTTVQVQLRDGRNVEPPFEYLGMLPIPQDIGNPQQQNFQQATGSLKLGFNQLQPQYAQSPVPPHPQGSTYLPAPQSQYSHPQNQQSTRVS